MSACLSVPTLDEKAWRATEPHTPSPRARLDAVAKLNAAGIPAGVLIAPLMPGVNDAPEQVAEIVRLATEAGATSIGGQVLFLQGSVRGIFFDWLREHRPDLLPRYERLYRNRSGCRTPTGRRSRPPRARRGPAGRGWTASGTGRTSGCRRCARPSASGRSRRPRAAGRRASSRRCSESARTWAVGAELRPGGSVRELAFECARRTSPVPTTSHGPAKSVPA